MEDGVRVGALLASMRPRVFPAEDLDKEPLQRATQGASMRPRVFPAEDIRRTPFVSLLLSRFNEAAGIPRGRQAPGLTDQGAVEASMRPRVFPAEDYVSGLIDQLQAIGFNEAAGIPRGRRARVEATKREDPTLQ